MALGSCFTCIKYMMFGFNFIFWLLGCAILGVGIWLRVDDTAADFVSETNKMEIFYTVAYVLIAIGFIIMVIGFLGCCGAIRESQCMLATFFMFLFIIFATLLGFGIWAVVAKGSFKKWTESMLDEGVKEYKTNNDMKNFMDSVQRNLECCGAGKGAADYAAAGIIPIPESCNPNETKPCNPALYDWLEAKLVIIAGIAIGIAVIMILGMVFSMVLCCAIRDNEA